MTQHAQEIKNELEDIITQWEAVHNRTTQKVSQMQPFYSNPSDRSAVLARRSDDHEALKEDHKEHKRLAARYKNTNETLTAQVKSSRNRVERLKKYGPYAAIGFLALCAIIGGSIGAKVPGLGQVLAIVVGVALGLIVGGLLSLVLYCGYKRKFENQRDMWNDVQSTNEHSLTQAAVIPGQRGLVGDIREGLNGIEEGNLDSGLKALQLKMNKYVNA